MPSLLLLFDFVVVSVSLDHILPLAFFRFLQLPLELGDSFPLTLTFGIIVAALATLRFLFSLILTQELAF
jgi:hypothetical protein